MRPVRLLALAALVASAASAHAESLPTTIVKNDGFLGDPPVFRSGFGSGDTFAARLSLEPGFGSVIELEVVFGGAATGFLPVTVKIWDDTAQTLEPGAELFSVETLLTSSDLLQSIPLAGLGVPDRFRVGIVLSGSAPPTIAHDTDGTIDVDRNFTRRAGAGWQPSQAEGATGDWIIRARLAPDGGGGGGGGGGGACFGVDCPAGQFCDQVTRSCTFECVTADDCGGAFCNRNGQCVGEGAGCCQSSGGAGGSAAAGLGLAALAVMLARRRRR